MVVACAPRLGSRLEAGSEQGRFFQTTRPDSKKGSLSQYRDRTVGQSCGTDVVERIKYLILLASPRRIEPLFPP
jgi:hypothetical protein